jgi:hypothetical protein
VGASIFGSVGRGGRNIASDVTTIQTLINNNLTTISPLDALDVDGLCGPLTIGAIEAFQRKALRMVRPDGRVDTGGNTLRALRGERLPTAGAGLRVQYAALSNGYPKEIKVCDGPYDNHCALRMSMALLAAGFSLAGYKEPMCRHGHARGAESLAKFLARSARPERLPAAVANDRITGRHGIIFFLNIAGFRNGQGDHIDVWNGSKSKTGDYFKKAEEVWFWPLQ